MNIQPMKLRHPQRIPEMNAILPPHVGPIAKRGETSIHQDRKMYTKPYRTRKMGDVQHNDLLTIATAHKGSFQHESLTQPRDLDGNLVTMMPLSMGSWQAGADMSNSTIGVGLNNLNSRTMYAWPQKRIEQI